MEGGGVSWSELPPELINKIYEHITTISDYIVFRAVCRSWRSSVQPHSLPLQQSPWLSFPPSSPSPSTSSSPSFHYHLSFFTRPNSEKLHTLPLPFINDSSRKLLGCSYGYLVLRSQYHALSLFNPLSLSHIKLPPCRWIVVEKLAFSPPNPMCTVVVLFRNGSHLAICRPGFDTSWTFIDQHVNLHDAIFFEGTFYMVDSMGRVRILDDENACLKPFSGVPVGSITSAWDGDRKKCYLVGCDGYLFLIIRSICRKRTKGFAVYKRDGDGEWKLMKSLMNYVVFLGVSQSFMIGEGRCSSGFRSNCIYFLDDHDRVNLGYGCSMGDVGAFDMSIGKVGPLPYPPFDRIGFGYHQPFLWFTPTLL